MRGYIGLQIRHPGFESRRRLSSHPVASGGTRGSNACDSLDLGSSAFFVAQCGCSHPVTGKSGVSRPARVSFCVTAFSRSASRAAIFSYVPA